MSRYLLIFPPWLNSRAAWLRNDWQGHPFKRETYLHSDGEVWHGGLQKTKDKQSLISVHFPRSRFLSECCSRTSQPSPNGAGPPKSSYFSRFLLRVRSPCLSWGPARDHVTKNAQLHNTKSYGHNCLIHMEWDSILKNYFYVLTHVQTYTTLSTLCFLISCSCTLGIFLPGQKTRHESSPALGEGWHSWTRQ